MFGFRSGKWYKKIIALIYYVFGILMLIGICIDFEVKFEIKDLIVDKIIMFLLLIIYFLPFLLLSDFSKKIRNKIVLLRNNKTSHTIIFFVILFILLLIIDIGLYNLHSDSYVQYQEEQQKILEQQKAQEKEEKKAQQEKEKQIKKEAELKNVGERAEVSGITLFGAEMNSNMSLIESSYTREKNTIIFTGKVKQDNIDEYYSMIGVSFKLLDENGNVITTTTGVTTSNYLGNGIWEFTAYGNDPDNKMAYYKLEYLYGYLSE